MTLGGVHLGTCFCIRVPRRVWYRAYIPVSCTGLKVAQYKDDGSCHATLWTCNAAEMPGDGAAQNSTAQAPSQMSKSSAIATSGSAEQVIWPVDDPSEFRPELAPGGDLENLGKEKENFRVYYEVSWYIGMAVLCAAGNEKFNKANVGSALLEMYARGSTCTAQYTTLAWRMDCGLKIDGSGARDYHRLACLYPCAGEWREI